MIPDPKQQVRRGYDRLSTLYRADEGAPAEYLAWTRELLARLVPRSEVLDLGCGCGVPVARSLAAAGHQVTGVDFSEVQLGRARRLVPEADFICADMAELRRAPESFDAIVCLYAIIHLPLEEQPGFLARLATWLQPGGWLLLTAGARAWTGSQPDWLGGGTPMWWSQADLEAYRAWVRAAGLVITDESRVADGPVTHSLFWARRRAGTEVASS